MIRRFPMAGFLAVMATAGSGPWCGSSTARADDPPRALPADDRKMLDQVLGAGVVGAAVSPPALPGGVNDLLALGQGLTWRMRVVSGKGKGTEQTGAISVLPHPDDSKYRLDTGDGRNVLFCQVDAKSDLSCYAAQDNQEKVMSHFSPPQPIILANLSPGEIHRMTCNVSVADLARLDVEKHSGKLEIEFQYVGAYRMHVPAGDMDAMLFKAHLKGKIGPASVEDTIYRFFAKNSGPVAVAEINNISAALIYHDNTRVGKVLVETSKPKEK